MKLAALMALCVGHGLWVTWGLTAPPDLDALRDIGFAQGILDGNWWGDPAYLGAIRYYPPLIPALMAGIALVVGSRDLPHLWIVAGPWLGLLPVAMFFLMARAMFAARVGLIATVVFALWNGALTAPWVSGGYSPWLLTPLLAQAGFCGAALLIHARAGRGRWSDAVVIGAGIGVVFLAHVIPALLLTAMLVVASAIGQGMRVRTMVWLAVAGAVQLAFMLPYLLPILIVYPAGVVHLTPGAWVADELRFDAGALLSVALVNAPFLLAVLFLWRWRFWPEGLAGGMLLAWIGICALVLARHYTCAGSDADSCAVFRLPVHHFHSYLQIAASCVIGLALVRWSPPRPVWGALLAAGIAMLLFRPYDRAAHDAAPAIDLVAYHWILANTSPDAVFDTAVPTDLASPFDPGAFAVLAAGRKLVALHTLFSNPYVPWAPRERLRAEISLWRAGLVARNFCGAAQWAIVAADLPRSSRAASVATTPVHRIEKLAASGCN